MKDILPRKVPLIRTEYRTIQTEIPSPGTMQIIEELQKYGPSSLHGQLPLAWHRAVDFQVFDPDGNKWIDFTSAIFLTNSGHANPSIVYAIKRQLDSELLFAYNYPTKIRADFLKKLIGIMPPFAEKALLFSSGTEASECALLTARTYGHEKSKDKKIVVSFKDAMHGVTLGSELLRNNDKVAEIHGLADPNLFHLQFPFPWELGSKDSWSDRFYQDMDKLTKEGISFDMICAFMVESFRGWAAMFYPRLYMETLADFAKAHEALLIFDDIQGGFARTGRMFSFEHYGVEPDLVCLGKGISSSLPLSALVGRAGLIDLPEFGGSKHSTHSGNTLACAAGLANLEEIELRDLVMESARKGAILFDGLRRIQKDFSDRISYVSGSGLLAAVLFKYPGSGQPDRDFPSRVCELAMQKGLLLVHTGRESIKIAPPLTISDAALGEGVDVLRESISEICCN